MIETIELADRIAQKLCAHGTFWLLRIEERWGRDGSSSKRQARRPPSRRRCHGAGTAQPEAASRVGARRLGADRLDLDATPIELIESSIELLS